jgi:hypothetical protein
MDLSVWRKAVERLKLQFVRVIFITVTIRCHTWCQLYIVPMKPSCSLKSAFVGFENAVGRLVYLANGCGHKHHASTS